MSDPVNPFDFANETLAQFLAKSVGDGTYADVVEALKVDQVGEEAAATEIRIAAGQIYGNTIDDFVLAAYPLLASVAAGGSDTTQPISDAALYGVLAGATVSLAAGERGEAQDMNAAGAAITIELPEITPALDGTGSRCSFIVPTGNAGQDLIVTAFAGDGVVNPVNGSVVPSVTYSAGELSGYTVLTWEGVVGGGATDPASSILTFSPVFEIGSPPNAGLINCTATGTGGTLPTIPNMVVTLTPRLGSGQATLVSPGDITITSAVQASPGDPWTVTFDILAGELTVAEDFDCQIEDATGPTVPYAGMLGAFRAFPSGPPPIPQTPVPAVDLPNAWVHDTSNPVGSSRWDESLSSGPNSNGNDAAVSLGDSLLFDDRSTPLGDPADPPTTKDSAGFVASAFQGKTSFSSSVATGAGSFVDLLTAFDPSGGPNLNGNLLHIKIDLDREFGNFRGVYTMEEVWQLSSSTWFRIEMRQSSALFSNRAADNFRLIGSGGDLVLQILDSAGGSVSSRGVIEYNFQPGFTPS